MIKTLYVSPENKQNFSPCYPTISEALSSIPKDNNEPIKIFLTKGTYKEKLTINQPYITLEGESLNETIITYDDYAFMMMPDGLKRGTFRTPTVFIDTHDFMAKNITFQNNSGFGKDVGQALALYVDGDRIIFDHCNMLASQDTIFTGPLPPAPYEPNGFIGPKEFSPRINGRHYYHNCFIRGDIDFIFGSATAYFEDCEIFSQKTDDLPAASSLDEQTIYGYVTAASTAKGQEYGYVFKNCKLTSNCPPHSVYLGRPWRNYAKTIFIECDLGEHIHPAGWFDWNKKDAHDTIFYAEYHSTGLGASPTTRAPYSKQLTDTELIHYSREKVLAGNDHWQPCI